MKARGGVSALLANWPSEVAPNRTTVSRWLGGITVPQSSHQLLSLAAAMDVDPFALWSPEPEQFAQIVTLVVRALRQKKWGRLYPALSFIEHFNGPVREWPPVSLAVQYYRRSWFTHDFEHHINNSSISRYATVVLQARPPMAFHEPHVFHFAWRDARGPVADWRPYGLIEVSRCDAELRLLHFNGVRLVAPITPGADRIAVETFFGPRPAQFRVASLHEFDLLQDAQLGSVATLPTVRFP